MQPEPNLTVGGETFQRSWGVLKSGGTLVAVAAQSEEMQDPTARDAFFSVDMRKI